MNTFLSRGKFEHTDSEPAESYKYGIWHLPDGRYQVMLEFDREGEEPRCYRCHMTPREPGDKMNFLVVWLEQQTYDIAFGNKPDDIMEMAAIGKEMFDREFAEFERACEEEERQQQEDS